jgi:hypothetical protein
MAEYDIQGPTRVCAASGQELKPGDRFFGVLLDEDGKLVRKDYSEAAWPGPPDGHLAYWVGHVPTDDKPRKPVVNDEVLLDCFDRLRERGDPDSLNFRYVAALLLMRKKKFRFEDAIRDEAGREVLSLRDSRNGAVHQVIDPKLSDEQVAAVQAEVFRVLGWTS